MKYMLLIYGNEEAFSSVGPETFAEIVRETDTLNQELFESGEPPSAPTAWPTR